MARQAGAQVPVSAPKNSRYYRGAVGDTFPAEAGPLLVPTPSTLGNLWFGCWSPGLWDLQTEPTDRLFDLLQLMTPQVDRLPTKHKGVAL